MRKISVFLSFSLFVLILFSCDFQLPKGVEIHGNPTIAFAAHNDIGKTFEEMNANGDQTIECITTNTRTYIIRKEITDGNFFAVNYPGGVNATYTSPVDKDIGTQTLTVSVNFGAVLTNFDLVNPNARVYIYGDEISEPLVERLKIKAVVSADGETNTYIDRINRINSGLNDSTTTYAEKALPGGANNTDIELPLNSPSMSVSFDLIIPAGEEVKLAWFQGNIHTEILIWVPLIFEATDHAEVIIPPGYLFPIGKDLFGRDSKDESSFIVEHVDSLDLSIILNQNPFIGRELVIWSGPDYANFNIKIVKDAMEGNAFSFPIGEEDMAEINKPENWPFVPNFRIEFKNGDKLVIPRELTAHELVFKAKFRYKTEF